MSYKIVNAADLRAIGVPVNEAHNMDSKKDQSEHWYSSDPYFGFKVTYRYEEIDKEIEELRRLALGFLAQEALYTMVMEKISSRLKWKKEAEPTVLAHKRQMAEIAAVPNIVKNVCSCSVCGANVDREYSLLVCQNNPAHLGDSGTGIIMDHTYPKGKR